MTLGKTSEENLARVNRALRVLSAGNKALIHAHDEQELLIEVCNIVVNVGGYCLAWVGYCQNDDAHTVKPMAAADGFAEHDYLDQFGVSWSVQNPLGRGPGGQSIRSKSAVLCADVRHDPMFSPWLASAERNGIRGVICLPLAENDHAFGLLALYSTEILTADEEEITLLQDLANNLAFGITSVRSRKERQHLESAVLKVAAGVSGSSGAPFFEHLTTSMTDAVGAQAGVIARFLPGNLLTAKTICAVFDGITIDSFEYDIVDSPCEKLMTETFCVVQNNVRTFFPKSIQLVACGAQAYVGRRLDDSRGRAVGLLYVLFRQPLQNVNVVTSTIQIFAVRAAAELERYESDLRIRDQAALLDKTQDAIIVCDVRHRILLWNKGAERLYGWTADEVLGKIKNAVLGGDSALTQEASDTVLDKGEWSGQFSYLRKDGGAIPVEAHWSLVKDDDGRAQSIFAINTDISQRKADEREIQHLAFYDTLTGLPNRQLLLNRLKKALTSGARSHNMGALLFIDLDNFKSLNDTVGHDKGDLLLKQVAARLQSCIRRNNTVARLGGDEFVIVLEDLDTHEVRAAAQAEATAEKVLDSFRTPFQLDGVEHHSTASVGITLFTDKADSVDDLLKRADLAMYQAKSAGRNAIRFFDPEMQRLINARVALESDLRDGFRRREFSLHYQAQVDRDGQLTGTEALLRWAHPTRGIILPAKFISLAEDTGLILPLGAWVLESACAQLAKWAGSPDTAKLSIAINVSVRQFRHENFVSHILDALARHKANPHQLKIELTESLLVDDMEAAIAKMNRLKLHGVGFSLDDFGTGYSSLSYLKRLPLDQLKIDQSFVKDVLTDFNDAVIAKTIVVLGQSLGLLVIAEGVETVEQRDALAEYGCDAYQGYLYGRPLPIDLFEHEMRRDNERLLAGSTTIAPLH